MQLLEIFNPVFWIFISYAFGVFGTGLLQKMGIFEQFENHNYISDKLTKWLGVLYLGWLIRHSFMGKFNQRIKIEGRPNKEQLEQLKYEMTLAENGHLIAFVLLQIAIFLFPIWGVPTWQIIAYTIFNIIFNLYLVFLQQYNKRRIDRVLKIKR